MPPVARGLVTVLLLLPLATPLALADLRIGVDPLPKTLPTDGSYNLTIHVEADCEDVLLVTRPPPAESGHVDVVLNATGITFLGEQHVTVDADPCPEPWAADLSFTVVGDAFLPGLVAIPVSATVFLHVDPAVEELESDPASTAFELTPAAVVDVEIARSGLLPEDDVRELPITLSVTSRSNIPVYLAWQAVASPASTSGDGVTLALGNLSVPAPTRVPAQTAAGPGTANATALYAPPAKGRGTDLFEVFAPIAYADETSQEFGELSTEIQVSYDGGRVGAEVTGGQADNKPDEGVPGLLMPATFATLAGAVAWRRR